MSQLEGIRVLIAADPGPEADAITAALEAQGAVVDRRVAERDLLLGLDARPDVVLVVQTTAIDVVRLLVDTRGSFDPDLPVALVGDAGAASAGPSGRLPTVPAAPAESLAGAVRELGAARRRARELEERMLGLAADARRSSQALAILRQGLARLEHDLRTPLGVAMGFAANLRDGIDGPVTEIQGEHASLIVRALLGAQSVLEEAHGQMVQVVELAAPAHGGAPVVRRPQRAQVALTMLAAEVVDLLRETARQRGVAVSASGEPGVVVWGSAAALRQLVTNLVANAIKFTPAGRRVEVRVGWRAAADGERREAELVVADDGPGVPVADRERIFESGARLARDASVPGQGIGLSVCRDVAAQHGGSIRVEDTAGGGATFVVALPQDRRARSARGVVVVRDEQEVAAIVEALLSERPEDLSVKADLGAPGAVVVVPKAGATGALEAAVRRVRQRQEQDT